MQAAVNRLPDRKNVRQGEKSRTKPHLATADDAALLGALPIAAAIIGKAEDGLKVLSYNERFRDSVELSTCTALDWDDAECLRDGPIAEALPSSSRTRVQR